MGNFSRRDFLRFSAATAAVAATGSSRTARSGLARLMGARSSDSARSAASTSGKSLNIYSWSDYFAPKNIDLFEKQTGITVSIATYDSDAALYSKLLLEKTKSGFDIVIPTSSWIPIMKAHGLLEPLDHSQLSLSHLDPGLLNKNFDPGNKYSIPKDYGVSGLTYNPTAVGQKITTWEELLQVGAQPHVSGKVALNSSYELIGIALWAAGKNWNSQDPAVIEYGANIMKKFAKHVKTFTSYDLTAIEKGELLISFSDQALARTVILKNPAYEYVVPLPKSELWIDNYAITRNAANLENAYKFINFQLEPKQQITDTEYLGYPTALNHLETLIPKSVRLRTLIFVSPSVLPRLQEYIVYPSVQELVDNEVQEIIAAA